MIRSLWIARTGLDSQQMHLDIISNNLANVSTAGFKRSRPVFEDLIYQNLRQAGAQSTQQTQIATGLQIGTGVRPVATERIHTQGNLNQTGNDFDVAITPSTTPTLTEEVVDRFAEIGVTAMGISLDGPNAEVHDAFRKVEGTFERSAQALRWARERDLRVQVNTTVTTFTLPHIPEMFRLLSEEHSPPVRRWKLFQLVPVGRGARLGLPSPAQIDELFAWVYEHADAAPFHVGTVEAPHYRRYWIERKKAEGVTDDDIAKMAGRMGFGIRDGNGIVFVSHRGEVYPAGFLPHPLLGNVKKTPLETIYRESPAMLRLRDAEQLAGRCGRCAFRYACGGSRARAYATTGDIMGEDPLCTYEPASLPS